MAAMSLNGQQRETETVHHVTQKGRKDMKTRGKIRCKDDDKIERKCYRCDTDHMGKDPQCHAHG